MYLKPLLEMGPGPIFLFLPCFGLSFLSNKVFIQQKKNESKKKKTFPPSLLTNQTLLNYY